MWFPTLVTGFWTFFENYPYRSMYCLIFGNQYVEHNLWRVFSAPKCPKSSCAALTTCWHIVPGTAHCSPLFVFLYTRPLHKTVFNQPFLWIISNTWRKNISNNLIFVFEFLISRSSRRFPATNEVREPAFGPCPQIRYSLSPPPCAPTPKIEMSTTSPSNRLRNTVALNIVKYNP